MPLPVVPIHPPPSVPELTNWPGDRFSIVADTLGILGFFVTLFLTGTTWQLKKQLEQKKRLPQLLKTVTAHCAFLQSNIPLFPACRFAAKLENGKIIGNLMALKQELGMIEGRRTKATMKAIRIYEKKETAENLENICASLLTLAALVDQKIRTMNAD